MSSCNERCENNILLFSLERRNVFFYFLKEKSTCGFQLIQDKSSLSTCCERWNEIAIFLLFFYYYFVLEKGMNRDVFYVNNINLSSCL